MPIREMQRYAALRESGFDRANEKSKILEDHRAVLEEQIVTLQKAHALLTHSIEDIRKIEVTQPDSASESMSQWNAGAIAAST